MRDKSHRIENEWISDLTDDGVYDAMSRLPGHLDITTDDFRDLYRLAYDHALKRLAGGLKAQDLMGSTTAALSPELSLIRAAELMSAQQLKSSPVSDDKGNVVGMLSETDVLRRLGVATILELITQLAHRRTERDLFCRGRL